MCSLVFSSILEHSNLMGGGVMCAALVWDDGGLL